MKLNLDDFYGHRPERVRDAIKALSRNGDLACSIALKAFGDTKILAAHDGRRPDDSPRNWRFQTTLDGIKASYLERWRLLDGRAYEARFESYAFALFRGSEEVFAIHAEPFNTATDHKRLYKAGPHVHLSCSPPELAKMHLPLCLQNVEQVINDLDRFDAARNLGIQVVREDVFSALL